ncbi:hypothetical protein niasHT_030656 [Heterodera trifolii]|uniref:Uncharacterized protein n=1 Tax=Heterodera trifolii TaxID=157864 RepID=A0ABD2HUF1_9BILA
MPYVQLCFSFSFSLIFILVRISVGSRLSPNGGSHHNLRHSFANKQFIDQLEDGSYEIVHPFQIRDRKERIGIDTRNHFINSTHPQHYRHITIVIRSSVLANARLKLLLSLNEHIFHEKSSFRKLDGSDESPLAVENCFYQGTINGNSDTLSALSTCDGLLGLLAFPNGTVFAIWPLEGGDRLRRHPHVLYRARMANGEAMRCGAATKLVTEWHRKGGELGTRKRREREKEEESDRKFERTETKMASAERERKQRHGQRRRERRERRQTQSQSRRVANKFIGLALIGDHSFMLQFNRSAQKAAEFALNVVNLADLLLRRDLGVCLSVTFAEFWVDKQRLESANAMDVQRVLGNALDYATGNIYDIEKDATVLLTGQKMSGGDKMAASFASICTSRAVGVVQVSDPFGPHANAIALAHSVAHLLGIDHDTSECTCDETHDSVEMPPTIRSRQCIMTEQRQQQSSAVDFLPLHFSACSIARLHSLLHQSLSDQLQCLFVQPFQTSRLYQCGNGVLDGDEQCDCGRRDQCDDPCCDPLSCQLKAHAQCASHQPCCEHCQLRSSGYVCRQSKSVCDIAEKCDGKSGDCPSDEHLVDGVLCGLSGLCWKGECVDAERQCQELWGQGAKPADEQCFLHNSRGLEYGHCGRDVEGRFVECARENARCGVLHCRGGGASPLGTNASSFNLQFAKEQRHLQCKVVVNSANGMVKDGTSCGSGRICVRSVCVPLTQVSPPVPCPSSNLALSCSGHGDCTTGAHCVCFDGWTGLSCALRIPSTVYNKKIGLTSAEDGRASIEFVVPPSIRVNGRALETATLLGILLLVGFLLLLLLICLLLFYRRKSSVRAYGREQNGPAKVADEEDCGKDEGTAGRAIKFGQMPSYREEKMKRKANKKIYGALQRITEANEADSLSLKSRESSCVGAVLSVDGRMQTANGQSILAEVPSLSPHQPMERRLNSAPPSIVPNGEIGTGCRSRPISDDEMGKNATEMTHFGAFAHHLRMNNPSPSFGPLPSHFEGVGTFAAPPPRLPHIQMLMRRLEGSMGEEIGVEEEGHISSRTPSVGGNVPCPAASTDSGHPGSNFDIRAESPSLFSDPYKLDRLDLPG